MNIIITGGAGYVGYSVSEHFAKKYPSGKIVIFDNFSKARLEKYGVLLDKYKNIEIIPWEKADIRDLNNFQEALKKYQPETIIHLAAIVDAFTTNREGKDRECLIVNHEAAVALARAAKEVGVRNFFFQSSVSVYSRGEDLCENSPKESISTYGASKFLAEEEILKLSDDNFRTAILRSATLVGYNPCFRHETIINLLCIRAVYGIETNVFESALYSDKSYLNLADEVQAIDLLLENIASANGQIYNVKSFNADLDSVIKIAENKLGKINYQITSQKTISQQVYTINCDKIIELGYRPIGNLAETVETTISRLVKQKKLLSENN